MNVRLLILIDQQLIFERITSNDFPFSHIKLLTGIQAAMESTIPIIDLSAMCLGKTAESSTALEIRQLADEMYRAFCTVGFVYIKNHGIPREKVRISFLGLVLLNRN